MDHGQASATRHVEVGDDEVGAVGVDDVDRALGLVGLAHDLEVVGQFGAQAAAHQLVVVGQHHADRHDRDPRTGGAHNVTSVPAPVAERSSARPPSDVMRPTIDSVMP